MVEHIAAKRVIASAGDSRNLFGVKAMLSGMKTLLAMFVLFAFTVLGADVSGKWSGTFEMTREGESHSGGVSMVLKQDGGKLTGTVGPSGEQQFSIKSGSIQDDRIHLEVVPDEGPALVKFELKLDGNDHILGDMVAEGGDGGFKGKIDVNREK